MEDKNIFPDNFMWGAASAACQMEGGVETRGLTVSDIHLYDPNLDRKDPIENELTKKQFFDLVNKAEENKDGYFPKRIGNDFFHRYKEDIDLMAEMGMKAYRFSLSWSRCMKVETNPFEINEEGFEFYDNVINYLIQKNIEPIITIVHYDTPLDIIINYGGFDNKDVVELFMTYAREVIKRYHNRVKYFIPFNQINLLHYCGFKSIGVFKDVKNYEERKYIAVHNQFKCNALLKKFAKSLDEDIKIGVMLADCTYNPRTCNPKDIVLAMKRNRMQYFYADVNLRGEYPSSMLRYFRENNINLELSEEDKSLLKENKLDFLALSYYYSWTVDHKKDGLNPADVTMNPYLKANDWGWTIDPEGFYNVLCQYHDRYNKPIMIAENGFGYQDKFENNTVNDDYRINYLESHIKMIKESLLDGVKIIAYLPWTSIDIISSGTAEMSKRYGFVYVDADDLGNGSYDRYKKKSFYWYKNLIENNGINL
ncbi:glycoside hydrolase family 1 protein [Helcococcus kunzii]|uniref:glycoside hydrolase family 1 protein n=1 Tax=Helcococcus kunzii TaxID=40091 RepID=UPI0024AD9C07|nr:glycoside hydrolase family 1 protein [Helcococcus kunzii]